MSDLVARRALMYALARTLYHSAYTGDSLANEARTKLLASVAPGASEAAVRDAEDAVARLVAPGGDPDYRPYDNTAEIVGPLRDMLRTVFEGGSVPSGGGSGVSAAVLREARDAAASERRAREAAEAALGEARREAGVWESRYKAAAVEAPVSPSPDAAETARVAVLLEEVYRLTGTSRAEVSRLAVRHRETPLAAEEVAEALEGLELRADSQILGGMLAAVIIAVRTPLERLTELQRRLVARSALRVLGVLVYEREVAARYREAAAAVVGDGASLGVVLDDRGLRALPGSAVVQPEFVAGVKGLVQHLRGL